MSKIEDDFSLSLSLLLVCFWESKFVHCWCFRVSALLEVKCSSPRCDQQYNPILDQASSSISSKSQKGRWFFCGHIESRFLDALIENILFMSICTFPEGKKLFWQHILLLCSLRGELWENKPNGDNSTYFFIVYKKKSHSDIKKCLSEI